MNYQELAKQIIIAVGGEKNISNLTHCATRLRFNLVDDNKADVEQLKSMKEVMGTTIGGGQFQIIIGSEVRHVYKEIQDIIGTRESIDEISNGEKKSMGARFIDVISSIFTPILPAITASGMIKAVLALLVAFSWVDNTSMSYQIINFMADAGFYFLPILLANSAAKKFKANPYLAMMVGGILLHPSFIAMVTQARETGEALSLGFLPVYNATYASSVVPIILSVWFMSYVEKYADSYSPKVVKFFLVPLITIMVTGIAAVVVLGPIGFIVGNGIASGITFLETHVGWLVPMVLGGVFPLLVLTGTHYGIIPIGANNIMSMGYDTMVGPGNLASNIAQGGATFGVALKTKNREVKELAYSAGITAVCGITEPALFGINVRFKTPLYSSMIGGAAGGLFIGLFGVRRFATGSPGLMTLPVYIGENGLSNLMFACIGSLIAFVVALVASYMLFKEDVKEENELQEVLDPNRSIETVKGEVATIFAPISGERIDLTNVNDYAFSSGAIGSGCAIIPNENIFVSPVDGIVKMVFETKHAVGIESENGVEILIHVGIDTVKLEGKPFEALVQTGEKVREGQPILKANLDMIKEAGYDVTTPIVITNHNEFKNVKGVKSTIISSGELLLEVGN